MATFQVTDPTTGRSVRLTGDSPPTEQELEGIFSQLQPVTPPPTAQPVAQPTGARERRGARAGRVREEERTQAQQNLQALESGQVTSQDLTVPQIEAVQRERLDVLPELVETGISNLAGVSGTEAFGTAAAALTALNPQELGQILTTQFPHVGVVTTPPTDENPKGMQVAVNNETGETVVINRPGVSSTDILQGLGLIAAFSPGTRVAAAAPAAISKFIGRNVASKLGVAATAQLALAGATEAGIQGFQEASGGEFNESEIALAMVLAGGAELIGPAARGALEKARKTLRAGQETAEQKGRRELIEQTLGTQPTRAQVTQAPADFQLQQEAAKGGGPVREALDIQEQRIGEVLDQAAQRTGGRVATSESTPINEVLNRSLLLDDQIAGLYKQAREAAPTTRNIATKNTLATLGKNKGFETKSGGVISAARSILRDKGITTTKPKNVRDIRRQDISVATAENIRQSLNALFSSANPTGKRVIRELKDSLDEDVFSQVGKDFFKQARDAKRSFEEGLERAGVSKFDTRGKNIIRDMLENKLDPDQFVETIVFGKGTRAEDIKQVREFLTQTRSGQQAFNDIKAQAIDSIRSKMFNQKGELIPSALGKSLDKIGKKADELFNAEEKELLSNLREVVKLRIPTGRETLGLGPSAQAVQQFKTRFPIIGPLLESLSDFKKNKFLLKLPKKFTEDVPVGQIQAPTPPAQLLRQE